MDLWFVDLWSVSWILGIGSANLLPKPLILAQATEDLCCKLQFIRLNSQSKFVSLKKALHV